MKAFVGLLLGLLIGAGCRYFGIPLPGPPTFVGGVIIVAIKAGYLGMDGLLRTRPTAAAPRPAAAAERHPGNRPAHNNPAGREPSR